MKKGFVLISTLALIVILSFIILILSRTIYSDTLKSTLYAKSVENRIEIINYESFLIDTLIDNSLLNRNLLLAENELNLNVKSKFPNLSISLEDYSTCFNLNTLVKPFQNINIKNDEHGELFINLLTLSEVDKNIHKELVSRIYDSLDDDSLPETFGAEDLFYIANDNLSLNPDQLYFHKSQIKNLSILDKGSLNKIYMDLCTLPTTDIQFNVNSLDENNMKVFLSLFPDLNINDIEKIILNRPLNGYITYKNLTDLTGIDSLKLNKSYIIFKPTFIKINYLLNLEGQIFNFSSLLSLKRGNFVAYRSLSR